GQRAEKRVRSKRIRRRAEQRSLSRGAARMNSDLVLGLMSFLFLFFGYLGVPVPFALMAGVLVGASFTQVSHIAIIQKMFDGMDAEALLAIPFFLLVWGDCGGGVVLVLWFVIFCWCGVVFWGGGFPGLVGFLVFFFGKWGGSTPADVAVISRALGRPMKNEGYSPAFIAAIIASA